MTHTEQMTHTKPLVDDDAEATRIAKDLEVLERLISRDLKKPLRSLTESCQSLLEQHGDLFDRKARSLIEDSLDAISDMQSLVEGLRARARAWQSTGRCRRAGVDVRPAGPGPQRGD